MDGLSTALEAFIAVILLILWSSDVYPKYHLVELFSGAGKVGEVWRLICADHLERSKSFIHVNTVSGRMGSMWGSMTGTMMPKA